MYRPRRHFKKNDGAHNYFGEEQDLNEDNNHQIKDFKRHENQPPPKNSKNDSEQIGDG